MNREMWAHPATQRNVAQLQADGAVVLPVGQGDQACGEVGDGRMLEPPQLLDLLLAHFQPKVLAGQRVLVTAGPRSRPSTRCVASPTTPRARWGLRLPAQRRRLGPR